MKLRIMLATMALSSIFLAGFASPENIAEDPSTQAVITDLTQKKDIEEFKAEWDWIYTIEDDYEFWTQYKNMLAAGDGLIDPPEKLTDYYSESEVQMLYAVVGAEIGNYSFDQQCNVASAIMNRMESERFDCDTLAEVLTPSQFATISNGRWKKVKPKQITIDACDYVFTFGDTVDGATFFESGNSNIHSKYATFVMNDGAHKFYK